MVKTVKQFFLDLTALKNLFSEFEFLIRKIDFVL